MKNIILNLFYVATAVLLLSLPSFANQLLDDQFSDMRNMISQSINNALEDCKEDYVRCANNIQEQGRSALIKELEELDEVDQKELMDRAIKEKKMKAIEIFAEADFRVSPSSLSSASNKILNYLKKNLSDDSKCALIVDSVQEADNEDLKKALNLWDPADFSNNCSVGRLLDIEDYDTNALETLINYVGTPDKLYAISNIQGESFRVSLLSASAINLVNDGADKEDLCVFLIERGADINQEIHDRIPSTVKEYLSGDKEDKYESLAKYLK